MSKVLEIPIMDFIFEERPILNECFLDIGNKYADFKLTGIFNLKTFRRYFCNKVSKTTNSQLYVSPVLSHALQISVLRVYLTENSTANFKYCKLVCTNSEARCRKGNYEDVLRAEIAELLSFKGGSDHYISGVDVDHTLTFTRIIEPAKSILEIRVGGADD